MKYKIELIKTSTKVKGEEITFYEKVKFDLNNNERIFDPVLEQENDINLFNEYRKKHNLLTSEKIKNIRKSLGVSQIVFAQVLGFGDKTITRYENGSIQDMAQNNLIKAIGEKPILFLENFKSCIKLKERLGEEKFKEELNKVTERVKALKHFRLELKKEDYKIKNKKYSSTEIALAVLNIYPHHELKDYPSHLKLQKLMYFIQGNYIGLFEKPLIDDSFEAWRHGPVFKEVYHMYSEFKYHTISHNIDKKYNLSDKELEKFILKILKGYGKYSARELEKLSHHEEPWKLARKRANVGIEDKSSELLDNEEIKNYYKKLLES